GPEMLGRVDVVLLSHDHHFDNFDHAGRAVSNSAGKIITTVAGAERLGKNAMGLVPWQEISVATPAGGSLRVIATPARHGPAHMNRGPVIGFVLFPDDADRAIYISGDTVWHQGVAEVGQ